MRFRCGHLSSVRTAVDSVVLKSSPVRVLRRNFYGVCAVGLAAWETTAWTTHRLPTVTAATRKACQSRKRRVAQLVVLAWSIGLARHLLTPGEWE